MRRTRAQIQVATALLADPDGEHWGYDLRLRSGVRSGVLYPMLTRMLNSGLLTDGWENPAETGGRPPRRYYRVTDLGKVELAAFVADQTGPKEKQQ